MAIPAASSEDLVALIRQTLLQDAAVKAIAEDRVHGAHILDPDNKNVVYPMVIFELEGGYTGGASTFQTADFYLYTYTRNGAGESYRLYDACHAALQQQLLRRDGVSVAGYCLESARPEGGWNEVAKAYFARGYWTARVSYRSGS